MLVYSLIEMGESIIPYFVIFFHLMRIFIVFYCENDIIWVSVKLFQRGAYFMFLLLAGGLLIILLAVVIAVVSSVVSAVAAATDDAED